MKKMIMGMALLSTIVSMNAQAGAVAGSSLVYTSAGVGLVSTFAHCAESNCKLQAEQVLVDGQNYLASGEVTVYLNQKIKDIQASHPDLSAEEALEVLIDASEKILK